MQRPAALGTTGPTPATMAAVQVAKVSERLSLLIGSGVAGGFSGGDTARRRVMSTMSVAQNISSRTANGNAASRQRV